MVSVRGNDDWGMVLLSVGDSHSVDKGIVVGVVFCPVGWDGPS